MRSFIDLERTLGSQPLELGSLLARIDTGRGREQLFHDQRPELLERLAQHARIESITASNAIEGVLVDPERAETIALGAPRFRNRSEEDFAGYRDAIDGIIRRDSREPLTVPLILHWHRQLFHHSGRRGGQLKSDQNFIVSYESGRREVIFTPPDENESAYLLQELVVRYEERQAEGAAHPLVLLAALVLDFLAIHPVADGNGRIARLLTTHELLAQGYGVARYVSIEQRIFASKNTYYDRLYRAQRNWHTAAHDPWPWITYLVRIISDAYDDFEARVSGTDAGPANKQQRVREHVLDHAPSEFRRRDIERALPEVSPATVRLALNELRDEGRIEAVGGGPRARWRRVSPSA